MYSNGITLNASSYKHLFASTSGTLCVPVKPSAVIYSQLDYVKGTAAPAGQNGIPINRVRILNTLINQLVSMKQKAPQSEDSFTNLSNEQKDELIKQYQKEIQVTLANAQYSFAGLKPEAGNLISLSI